MRLASAFIKLPLEFDAERLAKEALQFAEHDWTYHPLRHTGNTALALVSANGEDNDFYVGEMRPTPALERCPYVRQVMASFETIIGRSRFMRLAPGADVPSHSDGNYSWRNRVRIHVPIITDPAVMFSSVGNIDVHMRQGEAWIFDNWRQHAVYNRSDVERIHLVIDTVGTSRFWNIAESGQDPAAPEDERLNAERFVSFMPEADASPLNFERFNSLPVRPPDEVENMLGELLDELKEFRRLAPEQFETAELEMKKFCQDWRSYWAVYWDSAEHIPQYELLAKGLKTRLRPLLEKATFDSNEANAYEVAAGWIADMTDRTLVKQDRDTRVAHPTGRERENAVPETPGKGTGLSLDEYIESFNAPKFDRPVFIVSAPRSGSTMLYEALQKNKDLWSIGDESQREIESIPALHPRNRAYESNALEASDYTPQIGALLMDALMQRLQNTHGTGYLQTPEELRPSAVRFLEKTPKNALRIPFLRAMFPDARFIYLHRAAAPNIGSIIDAWESQKFVTYPNLPDWIGPSWSLLLPPGWQTMRGRPLAEIAAWQWATTNRKILSDLSALPRRDWTKISYEALLDTPSVALQLLCEFAGIPYGPRMEAIAKKGFPASRYTLTEPRKDKWKRHENSIRNSVTVYAGVEEEIAALYDR
ncbi:MAG: sulfotransferase [Woeseiaceae bacterium]|nr:sulfotransferase [Woeseiaceae bacterium]